MLDVHLFRRREIHSHICILSNCIQRTSTHVYYTLKYQHIGTLHLVKVGSQKHKCFKPLTFSLFNISSPFHPQYLIKWKTHHMFNKVFHLHNQQPMESRIILKTRTSQLHCLEHHHRISSFFFLDTYHARHCKCKRYFNQTLILNTLV